MLNGPCGVVLSKNTDFTDAHGWVFSRIGYSCAAFSGVVLMRHQRDGSARILSHAERNASVEIGEICGRNILVPYGPFNILNTPPPNIHCFSQRPPIRLQIRHSWRICVTA